MSAVGLRDMPVIEAWPLDGPFSGHFAAAFPEGERSYPSAVAVARAAARIGSSVHFRPAPRAAANDTGSLPVLPPPQRERSDRSARAASPRTVRASQPVASGEVVPPG